MENDYTNIEHKQYVDACLEAKGLHRVYVESGGWGHCMENFYEVFQSKTK
jgi:TM2 domain-containing membrane protein YozV